MSPNRPFFKQKKFLPNLRKNFKPNLNGRKKGKTWLIFPNQNLSKNFSKIYLHIQLQISFDNQRVLVEFRYGLWNV